MDNKSTISIYCNDVKIRNMETVLKGVVESLNNGYAMLELYGENLFIRIEDLSVHFLLNCIGDIISARLFDTEKQIKLRRIRDDEFRVVADFQFGNREPSELQTVPGNNDYYFLWGYKSDKEGLNEYLFEERIPRLFSYPMVKAIKSFKERDRVRLQVRVYYDGNTGRPVWDKFVELKKWTPQRDAESHARQVKMMKEE